jgi:hypothetical protein
MSVSVGDQKAQASPEGTSPFPLNRVVALVGPFIAIVSGAVAAWLLKHFPGLKIDQTTLGTTISEGLVFSVAAAGTFAIHHKWLSGWQQYEQSFNQARATAAQIAAKVVPPDGPSGSLSGTRQPVQSNGQPVQNRASNAASQLADFIDRALPTWAEELVSAPATQADGSVLDGLDTAVTPDEPSTELQPLAGVAA